MRRGEVERKLGRERGRFFKGVKVWVEDDRNCKMILGRDLY